MLSLAVFYYGKAKPGIPLRSRHLSPVRCSSGMFSALNEKTGTRSRIGLIQFYYNWEEDKKYLLVEIYLAKQK
ncbi:MAG: hypothetical protein KHX81_14840 [Clostridium sp.]|nr:hypothetical protein [Clostridium sp.]